MLWLLQAETVDGHYEFFVVDAITETVAGSENSSHYDRLY
jgi:hypothetical protein